MRTRKPLPTLTLFVILIVALATLGIGYALWSRTLLIRGVVNTGNVNAAFRGAFTDDDDKVDNPALDSGDTGNCPVSVGGGNTSCDPAASGRDPKPRHDKDVGRCEAAILGTGDVAQVTKKNVYPGYFCTAWLDVRNIGSIPVRIASARINGRPVMPSVPTPFDLNGDGQPDVAIHLTGFQVCQQIDPNQRILMDIDQQILQPSPQNATLSYTVEVQLNQWNEECRLTLPTFSVSKTGLTRGQADSLAAAFGISADILQADGSARHTAENFLAVPMIPLGEGPRGEEGQTSVLEAFNFEALRQMQVIGGEQAIRMVGARLQQAELPFEAWGAIMAVPASGHSMLQAVDREGSPLTVEGGAALDTHVNFDLSLGGVPLAGPGAKVKVVLDGQGQVTNLVYAMRGLSAGPEVPIMLPDQAEKACEGELRSQLRPEAQNAAISVTSRLMYYAPPLDIGTVGTIYPTYACDGTLTIGEEEVLLRRTLIPAVVDKPVGPEVKLSATIDDLLVVASAKVSGGTAPYSYQWNSSTTPVVLPDAAEVEYLVKPPSGDFKENQEVVSVLVTDANGLTASASATLDLPTIGWLPPHGGAGRLATPLRVGGVTDVGTEWIGTCQGLSGSAGNAAGFVNRFSNAGITVRFNWGNQNAWERDFIDLNFRGDALDQDYTDNVDFTFYTGHANGDGWTFCSNQADGFLHWADNPRWGDSLDEEWLVIAACGPLQLDWGGRRWWQRWGSAFDGLHLFMGYQTVTWDNDDEGRLVATYALQGRTIRESWIQTAIDVQGPSEVWAVMGPINNGNWVNYNDHFWGRGSVGPDIRGGNLDGWWIIWGPS